MISKKQIVSSFVILMIALLAAPSCSGPATVAPDIKISESKSYEYPQDPLTEREITATIDILR